jgi:hypothetical protein
VDVESLEKQSQRVSAEDSIAVEQHSISKATWRSVMIPGWGQMYNRKYWKAGLVWAGMATSIGFAIFNHQESARFRDAYDIRIDDNPNTSDEFEGLYTDDQLIVLETTYRRWRDLSIIITVGIYAYNILDAHVDAQLFYFDVSDDLSFELQPTILNSQPGVFSPTTPGLSLTIYGP